MPKVAKWANARLGSIKATETTPYRQVVTAIPVVGRQQRTIVADIEQKTKGGAIHVLKQTPLWDKPLERSVLRVLVARFGEKTVRKRVKFIDTVVSKG